MTIFNDVLIRQEGETRGALIFDGQLVALEVNGLTSGLFKMDEVIDFYVHETLLFRPTVLRLSLRDHFTPYELQVEFASHTDLKEAVKLLRAAGLNESLSR